MTSDLWSKLQSCKEGKGSLQCRRGEHLEPGAFVQDALGALPRHLLAAHPAVPEQLAQRLGRLGPPALAAREQRLFGAYGRAATGQQHA